MNLLERDKKHIWHPLTQHKTAADALPITKAEGALLFDDKGKSYIDGIASWYTCMYGHCNPKIVNAAYSQMQQLDHVVFSGFTHKPAISLSEKLLSLLPSNQKKVFFSDNGSTSVEVAIKMALQYYFNKGEKRNTIIALEEGFHGDTFGAMSVSGLSVYNGPFEDFFIQVERIPVPTVNNINSVLKQLQNICSTKKVAAFVFEPLVQGAAAMKMYDATLLDQLLAWCKENNVLTIADEVMTGFGKTGKNFACEHLTEQPDLMCFSKSLTAGLVPMAITTCTQSIFDAFYDDDIAKGFFHAHTYSANPVACSAALAGLSLLESEEIQKKIQEISNMHDRFEKKIANHPKVEATRKLGVIFALDVKVKMERYGNLRNKLFNFYMSKGVFLRPLGNTVYILPPYIISQKQLEQVYNAIEESLEII